jgi:hypothetical protein
VPADFRLRQWHLRHLLLVLRVAECASQFLLIERLLRGDVAVAVLAVVDHRRRPRLLVQRVARELARDGMLRRVRVRRAAAWMGLDSARRISAAVQVFRS